MKILLGVIAGAAVAIVGMFAIEFVGHSVFPPPPGIDVTNPADMERIISTLPAGAFAFVLAAWFLSALAGAWTANRIAQNGLAGWIVALLVACGGVYTMLMITHPMWMWAAGILLPLAAAWLAQRMSSAAAA